jgi:hypothetical protein
MNADKTNTCYRHSSAFIGGWMKFFSKLMEALPHKKSSRTKLAVRERCDSPTSN